MKEKFIEHIFQENLLAPGEKVLVAVSGGVDSVALATLIHHAGFKIAIAHVNYQLRGEDSDKDEELVRKLALLLNAPFHSHKIKLQQVISENKAGVQEAAREIRYQWFRQLSLEHGYDKIATAHHIDDNAETVLFNMIRGTGLKGLAGIRSVNGNIIRPFLFATKEQIIQYAREEKLQWRDDITNNESNYTRNKIRNQIMPLIDTINPAFAQATLRQSKFIRSTHEYIQRKIRQQFPAISDEIVIDQRMIDEEDLKALLPHYLSHIGFNYDTIELIMKSRHGHSGRTFTGGDYSLLVNRGQLIIYRKKQAPDTVEIESPEGELESPYFLRWNTIDRTPSTNLRTEPAVALLPLEKLSFPLILRRWQEGDWFVPYGMKGKKKISDYLIDNKIPLSEKQQTLVLCNGNDICWIVGHRVDDRYRVEETSEKLLRVEKYFQ